jgi:hypothetical protein
MPQKVKLADAFCPVHKWDQYVVSESKVSFKEDFNDEQ